MDFRELLKEQKRQEEENVEQEFAKILNKKESPVRDEEGREKNVEAFGKKEWNFQITDIREKKNWREQRRSFPHWMMKSKAQSMNKRQRKFLDWDAP